MSKVKLSDHFSYKKLLAFVLPSVVMMLVTSIYSVVDGFFISNFVGKNAFAASNMVWPFLIIVQSPGLMLGTGGSALIAFILGQGKNEFAKQIFSMLVIVIAAIGLLVSIAGFLFLEDVLILLGAGDELINDGMVYGRIMLGANVFAVLQNGYQSFLITADKPSLGLKVSVVAGIANMLLDFLFVYLFKWGVAGAASATAVSLFFGGMLPSLYFARQNSSRLSFIKPKWDLRSFAKSCTNGSSEMMSNISGSVVGMLYNYQLLRLASENGVAAYGAIMYVSFLFMAVFFGYAMGSTSIVGYNFGASNLTELKNVLKKSLIITTVVGIIMMVLAIGLSPLIAKIYVGYDRELFELTRRGLCIYSFAFLLCGYNIFGSAFFTGLGNGVVSALLSFLRTFVLQIIAILVLPVIFGIDGIWLAVVFSEGVTLVITFSMMIINRKKYSY